MILKTRLFQFSLLTAFLTIAHISLAQRHSGAVFTIGLKKNFLTLKDVDGIKQSDFKGNISPMAGLSYSHVIGKKFSATYEFDFSYLKATYSELYNAKYEVNPITNPQSPEEIAMVATRPFEKKYGTLSGNVLGHYRIVKGFFVSAGVGYDRFMSFSQTNSSIIYTSHLESELRENPFNISLVAGLGYSTDKFRVDVRYHAGLMNLITPENNRGPIQYWRYDKAKLNHLSITFGYFLGKE